MTWSAVAFVVALVVVVVALVLRARLPVSPEAVASAEHLVRDAVADEARGDESAALAKFIRALRITRLGNHEALFGAAMIYGKHGRPDQAIVALKRLVARQPDYPGAREALADLLQRRR